MTREKERARIKNAPRTSVARVVVRPVVIHLVPIARRLAKRAERNARAIGCGSSLPDDFWDGRIQIAAPCQSYFLEVACLLHIMSDVAGRQESVVGELLSGCRLVISCLLVTG